MVKDISIYFLMFLMYSTTGWLMEVTLGLIQNKKFVNRGFLIGPYCPIYGSRSNAAYIFTKKIYR